MAACAACGCLAHARDAAHAVAAALAVDDLDAAIAAGLLDAAPCPACAPACRDALERARHERLRALAARERHRARDARLARRAQARAGAREAGPATAATAGLAAGPGGDSAPHSRHTPALPAAAAAALARARAKAAGRT